MKTSGKPMPLSTDTNAAPHTPDIFGYVDLCNAESGGESALASETALAISYNGINHSVMMVSPGNFEDFAIGFSLSNEIVHSPAEIFDIQVTGSGESHHANVTISNRAIWVMKQSRRQLTGTSGCGICGVEAIEQALPPLKALKPAPIPPPEHFQALRDRISDAQLAARPSGALHAALYIDKDGDIGLCREDIGRHNALDKLIGALSQTGFQPDEGFVVVTSRCSLELIQKTVRARIGTLASLSAPSSLTVQWARRYQLNLIHVPHHGLPRLYSPAPDGD